MIAVTELKTVVGRRERRGDLGVVRHKGRRLPGSFFLCNSICSFRTRICSLRRAEKRSGVSQGSERITEPGKKALRKNASKALVFQDEVEIHLHPVLARTWAKVGSQSQVPAPGKNEKQVVYGGVDYLTGRITHTVAAAKSGAHFLTFLMFLVNVDAGSKIRLMCDNGRFHHTKSVYEWLASHRDQIEIYRLPPYCPSLNLIERPWGHLKRTELANVLFRNIHDLTDAFRKGVGRVNGRRDKIGFMFDHDDILGNKVA